MKDLTAIGMAAAKSSALLPVRYHGVHCGDQQRPKDQRGHEN